MSRDVLAEALWPERLPADPSGNLSVLVRRARLALGAPSLIVTGPRGYCLIGDEACVVDAEMFQGAFNAGHRLLSRGCCTPALTEFRTALGWWGGDPLAEDAYSEWAQDYRRTLFAMHQQALEEGAQAAFAAGAHHEAVAWSATAVTSEPLREPAYLLLARSLAASGDCVAALRAIKTLQQRFAEEGLPPSSEAVTIERSIARRGFPEPFDEPDRLRALESYQIVGTPPEEPFDDLAKLAAQICHCPLAVVNFITKDSRWIKASYGLPAGPREGPRGQQVCAWTISQPGVLVIADAAQDERFRELPRVKAGYRFYAGAPLINPEGHALGTLCVVDFNPRELDTEQAEGLRMLARQAVLYLEQRRQIIRLTKAHEQLSARTHQTALGRGRAGSRRA